MFEASLVASPDAVNSYNVVIKGDLATFVKLHERLRERIISTGANDRYRSFLNKLAFAVADSSPTFVMTLDEIGNIMGIDRWAPPSYFAIMFGISPKALGARRRSVTLSDFIYTHPITAENAKTFSKFVTFNILFWIGEKTVSDVSEPIVLGNLDEKTVIVNKDGVFRLVLKKVPTASLTVTSAVNNYVTTLEQETKQYRTFLDQMIKDMKAQMQIQYEMATNTYLDKINLMYEYGYVLKQMGDRGVWFYKNEVIEPESLLYEGKVYPWKPLKAKILRYIKEYKEWLGIGAPRSSSNTANQLKYEHFYNTSRKHGSNLAPLERMASPYIQGIYINPTSILKEGTAIAVSAESGWHVNMDYAPSSFLGYKVCVGNLEKIVPALNAVPMIENTLKMMNRDSPLNPEIGDFALNINQLYPDKDQNSPDAVKPTDFLDMATFHTI